jgi:membrane protease YdiL (CAAX protease family)
VGILAVCLLIIPHIKFNLFWFSDWRSAYLVFGLCAPLVMELLVRRRNLSAIGFRRPENKRVLAIVAGIFTLYLVSRLVEPLALKRGYHFELRSVLSTAIIFPFLEEVLFRGLIQTRLESAVGAVRSWVLTGLFFGFYHYYLHYLVPGRAPTTEEVLGLVYLTALGMLLGAVFAKTRSLLPSFLIHAINNFSL